MKIRPVRAELFHADGRTNGQADRQAYTAKLIVAFRNFENMPKNKNKKTCIPKMQKHQRTQMYHKRSRKVNKKKICRETQRMWNAKCVIVS